MMGILSQRLSLSVRERLLLHLLAYQRYEDEFEVPAELTQAGIAESTNIARPNVSRAVKKLQEIGQVNERLSHIKGHKRQKKIYLLTQSGLIFASELNDNLGRAKLRFKNKRGKFEDLTINEIIERVPGNLNKLHVIHSIDNNGECDFSRLNTLNTAGAEIDTAAMVKTDTEISGILPARGFVHVETPPQVRRRFYGRSIELAQMNKWSLAPEERLMLIYGIPGIGKTTLALEFVSRRGEMINTFWYALKEWDNLSNFLTNLSTFLEKLERKKLSGELARVHAPHAASTADIIAEELAGIPALIVIDDFQNANAEIITLFKSLIPMLAHHNKLKILFLSRELIKFYDRRDVVLSKVVTELSLGGLDEDSSKLLLAIHGISTDEFDTIYRRTGGHPLYLELLSTAPALSHGSTESMDMMEFLHEEVFSKLTEAEQNLLKMASVFRYPVYAEAFFDQPEISYSHIDSLVARSYLIKRGLNLYDTHDLIRVFFQNRLSRAERKKFHLAASRYYEELSKNLDTEAILESEFNFFTEALLELQHHLIAGDKLKDALNYSLKYGRKLIEFGRFEFLIILEEFELDTLKPVERARLLLYKGEILSHLGAFDEAKQAMLSSRREFGPAGNVRELSHLAILIGENYAVANDWKKAMANYEQARNYLQEISKSEKTQADDYALARCYNNMALVLKKTGRTEGALDLYIKGLELLEEQNLGSIRDRVAVMENLGLLFVELNKPEYARDYFEKAITALEDAGDFAALAKLLATVGEVYVELGDAKTAAKFFEKGVFFWEQAEDAGQATDTFLRLGQVFTQSLALPSALSGPVSVKPSYRERLHKFFSETEQEGHKKISYLYDRIGSLYMHRGFWHKSLEFHKKALELFKKLNDDRGCAKVYNNLGVLYRTQQEPIRALESYKTALGYLEKLGERRGLAITHLNIARLYERLQKPQESKKAYEDCILAVSRDEGMIKFSGLAFLGLARQTKAGTSAREKYLKKAEEIFRKQNDSQNLAEVVRLKTERES